MKKIVILMMALLLSGCTLSPKQEQSEVYSFCGENDQIRISNGVIILSPAGYVFHGGNIYCKDGTLDNILSYSMEYYCLSGKEKNTIVTASAHDKSKEGVLKIRDGQGLFGNQDSGENPLNKFTKDFRNNIFFELHITDVNNKKTKHLINLQLTKIEKAENESN